METTHFRVTDEFGHYICEIDVPWEELYWIKKNILCSVQFGQLIIY